MAFIIPNSTDTTGGEEFTSLDQAEPDSLDFEILGHCRTNGVVSGCGVTTNGVSNTVNVAAGEVIVQGVHYTVSANAALGLPTQPSDTRFDVVVARESGGTTSLAVVQGLESASNPVYPQSMSVWGGAYDGSVHIDFTTDTVLAVLLRSGGLPVTAKDIVDKRVFVSSSVQRQTTGAPVAAATPGTLNFNKSHTVGVGTTGSGVWVYANNQWIELAANNQYTAGPPIGSTIWWNGATIPSGYLLEDGSAYDGTNPLYTALWEAIGTSYGGTGQSNFFVPNSISKFVRGDIVTNRGNTGGQDSITLTSNELPNHRHQLSHTHTMTHTHSASHNHTASSGSVGDHRHTINHDHASQTSGVSAWDVVRTPDGTTYGIYKGTYAGEPNLQHTHSVNLPNFTGNSGYDGGHSHTVTVNTKTLTTGGASASNTGGASTTWTTYVGSGQAFDNKPAYTNKVPCIRYA